MSGPPTATRRRRAPAIDRPVAREPHRTCVGCRRRRPSSALVRLTCVGDAPAVGGPSAGRGAWLCRDVGRGADGVDPTCLDRALRTGGFQRAWRREVDAGLRDAIRAAAGG